jgi:hypothetical protein
MARDPKTFWGWASAVAVIIPAAAAGTIHGTINALNGESFEEGFEQTSNTCWDAVTELADEHSDTITQGVLGAAARWATTQGLNAVNNEIKHHHQAK